MPATDTTPITVEFALDKETKNAVRFTEITTDERGLIGSIYLLKEVVETLGNPTKISVTVNAA